MYDKRNVLVTGAAGLVGQEAVRQLLDRGAHVRAVQFRERALAIHHPRLEIVQGDLMEEATCASLVRDMDVVVHAAGYVRGVGGRASGPADVVTKNLFPFVNVLTAASRAGVERLGWISSSTVYPDVDYPVREDEGFDSEPLAKYYGIGWTSRYCEKLSAYFHKQFGVGVAVIRASTIYGPHERFTLDDGHVLPALIIKAVQRLDPFPVWGDGTDVRDFTYVGDLVEGLLLAVEKYAVADPVNVGSGIGHSICDVVRLILEHERFSPSIVYQGERPSIGRVRVLDVGKAKRILGFEARTTLERGLAITIDWYKSTIAQG